MSSDNTWPTCNAATCGYPCTAVDGLGVGWCDICADEATMGTLRNADSLRDFDPGWLKGKQAAPPICTCCNELPAIGRAYSNSGAERDGEPPEPTCALCAPMDRSRLLPLED